MHEVCDEYLFIYLIIPEIIIEEHRKEITKTRTSKRILVGVQFQIQNEMVIQI